MAGDDERTEVADSAAPLDEVPATLGVMGLQGHIDAIESGRVYGWAWDPENPDERVSVDIYFKDDAVGSVLADRFRQDLVDVRVGDGSHAFVFDLPAGARDADPASVAVYFSATQAPLSRGGTGRLPLRDPEEDPVAILVDRVNRIETSVQQMFRAMHIIRRGEDDADRVAGVQELEALHKSVAELSRRQDSQAEVIDRLETATNASQSFIDRFDVEIHDRVTRKEIEGLRGEIARNRALVRLLSFALVAAVAGFAYLTWMFYR